jgi:hypothetical protein
MNKKEISLVFLLNFIIAFGFYHWNLNATIEDISSDLANIIPVCKKIDDPTLYANDLYLSEISDVAYYTPFFVQPLRFFAHFVGNDYLQGLNVLSFITHFFYGILWFFLFYKLRKDFWIALLFSLFMRGVIWPPGGELLGLSDLWTIMPRTIYSMFLPLPFLFYKHNQISRLILASFILGLIFNFHPISGIGGIVLYFSIYIGYHCFTTGIIQKLFFKKLLLAILFCFIGMLPFLMTYFLKVENNINFSQADFNLAFAERIPAYFSKPMLFIAKWNRPVIYLFGALFLVYYFLDSSIKKLNFKLLFISALVLFITANASVYVEQVLNTVLHKNLRMSFQLIRFQKLIIVVFQVGIFLLTVEIFERFKASRNIKMATFVLYCFILSISTFPAFAIVPFVGDDLTTSVLPQNLKIYSQKSPNHELAQMIDFIQDNTEKDAVFYGSYLIRAGANRAVVLESKGASMLIEGNPNRFIQWYYDLKTYRSKNTTGKVDFLKSKKVSYIVDDKVWEGLTPIKVIGNVYLYKI